MVTNWRDTVLYIGITNDLARRMEEHRSGLAEGFTKRYHLHKLVHAEPFEDVRDAIAREKQLKAWHRDWKWNLIRQTNPDLQDLTVSLR